MSSTNIEQAMPTKLAQALANSSFPVLDSAPRPGRHTDPDELDNHALPMDFQEYLKEFYTRYNVKFVRAPGGFFYLRPCSTILIPRSISSGPDMVIGRVLCYLYLSPERLANEGIFTQQELYDEPLTPADEAKLPRLVNNCSTGSDVNRQELQEKVCSSLNRLRRLGMVRLVSHDSSKFRIIESVFRLGTDVCADDNPREAQCRLIRDGEVMPIENHLQSNDETEENQPDSGKEE